MAKNKEDALVSNWIASMNTHDTRKHLEHFVEDAVLDDPSVGERFEGHEGIAEYFTRYFIGYNTTTRLVSIEPQDDHLHVTVDFTGDFPGGQTPGIFDVTVAGDKIAFVHADLT